MPYVDPSCSWFARPRVGRLRNRASGPELWYEPALLEAARRLLVHRRRPHLRRPRCAAGCGRWPCPVFRAALERVLTRAWWGHRLRVATDRKLGW